MPIISADDPRKMLLRESHNVRPYELEGESFVGLASRNLLPNPDLTAVRADGSLEGWTLSAGPRADGVNAYVRRATEITASGSHRRLDTRFARQNTAKWPLDEPHFLVNRPLIPGPTYPDPEKVASVAPPGEPVVSAVERTGREGYRAGSARVAFVWILGDDPMVSGRYTSSGPSVEVTFSQGQYLTVYLSEMEIPSGVTGIGIVLSPPGNTSSEAMTLQRRVDVRREVPPEVTLRGPYIGARPRLWPALSTNESPNAGGDTTHAAHFDRYGPPRWYNGASRAGIKRERIRTRLSYQLRTAEGWSAAQGLTRRIDAAAGGGPVTMTLPAGARRVEGVIGWRPLFVGDDGNWHAIRTDAPYFGLRQKARLYTTDVSKKGWKGVGKPVEVGEERPRDDGSGIAPPDASPQEPAVSGAIVMPPGRYNTRLTFTCGREESRSSVPAQTVLRDSGLASGGTATGTSDRILRIKRPHPQRLENARFVERDASGEAELDWERPSVPGVAVTTADGRLIVDDTSDASTDAVIRLSAPVGINPERIYTARFLAKLDRHGGGAFRVRLRFLDSDGAQIGEEDLSSLSGLTERWSRVRIATQERAPGADVYMPSGTASVALAFVCSGAGEARDFRAVVSNIGLWYGPAHARKRWPLGLGLASDDAAPERRSPDAEDEERPYPPGSYFRVVTDPDRRYVAHERLGENVVLSRGTFENSLPSGWSETEAEGGETLITAAAALQGTRGLKCRKSAASSATSQAFISTADYNGRNRVGLKGLFRIRASLTAGSADVLRVEAQGGGTPVARLSLNSSGVLTLYARNANTAVTQTVARGLGAPETFRAEIVCRGVGGSGSVEVTVFRGVAGSEERLPRVTLGSLDFSGLSGGELRAGLVDIPASATASLDLDNVVASLEGMGDADPVPGSYAEFFGVEGTPYSPERGMYGMRVPVEPETSYMLSAYMGTEGVSEGRPCRPFPSVITDERGNLLAANGPLASLSGDNYWDRYSKRIDTPPDAAYVEFIGGGFSDGLVRVMGLQFEAGTTPTPFTDAHEPEGYFVAGFDTALSGGHPAPLANAVRRWVSGTARSTHEFAEGVEEENAESRVTNVVTEWRTADREEDLAGEPWRYDFLQTTVRRFVEARVTLSTTEPSATPGVRGVSCEYERMLDVLLRPDGSEYRSGALVQGFTGVQPEPVLVSRSYAAGPEGVEDYTPEGGPAEYATLTVHAWRDSDKEEIEGFVPEEDSEGFVAEIRGVRYVLQPPGLVARHEVERARYQTGDDPGAPKDGWWMFAATGERWRVLSREEI